MTTLNSCVLLSLPLLSLITGCTDAEGEVGPQADAGVQIHDVPETGARTHLRWRRFPASVADLGRALQLEAKDLCEDADGSPCATTGPIMVTDYLMDFQGVDPSDVSAVCAQKQGSTECSDAPYIHEVSPRGVHVFALGANAPFAGKFKPLAEPGLTTPLVLDRVALLACGERVRRDSTADAVVFRDLDLSLALVTPETPGLKVMIADLYRRLLAREGTEEEISTIASITLETSLSAVEAARLSCFIIATTTEALFQ